MNSMFDQYNAPTRSVDTQSVSDKTEPTTSGYVTVRMKEEGPIFSKQKMNLNLPFDITHMTVCSGWLMMVMSNHVVFRLNLLQPDKEDEILLEKFIINQKVSNIFLDPLGAHLIIALAPKTGNAVAELLYLHRTTAKPKRIDKFRDHEVTAVAFNQENTSETTTGSILIGTNRGLIFETEFGVDGEKMFQNNWKQLPNYLPLYGNREDDQPIFDVGRGEVCPITGIEFNRVPNTTRICVVVTTLDRLYKFQETLKPDEKLLQNVFNAYLNVPEAAKDFLPAVNKLKWSKLRLGYEKANKFPKSFGWLVEPGIIYGEIDQTATAPSFILNSKTIPFPQPLDATQSFKSGDAEGRTKTVMPISFVFTEFHALLLYHDHVTAISLLNYRTVYEEYFIEQHGRLFEIVKDQVHGGVYVYSAKAIFRIKVTAEHRHIWRMFLERNEFELAKKYASDNPAHMDVVLVKQAEMLFDNAEFIRSAIIFSETQSSFEEVCLKFLEINETDALMIYLRNRLNLLKASDKTQITMLVMWIAELYLTEIARAKDNERKMKELQIEFDRFMQLPQVVECMKTNRTAIYDLMASHGDKHNLAHLTTVHKDYEAVLNQHISQNCYNDALNVLRQQSGKTNLFYKYAPILMEQIPKETVAVLKAQGKLLDPIRLIPTLITNLSNDEHIDEVIRYLEFCVYSIGVTEQSIHNFIVNLYAKRRTDKLMSYLETQGKDLSLIHYDVYYAFRVCDENGAKEACVFIQCLLELWEQAVKLALTFDTKLAQQTAAMPKNKEMRRKLWLKIAEHEITGKNDVKEALKLLKQCDLLRIEDLLPFFSDFQKIDDFKDVICDALKEYNFRIQEQRRDMEESAKSAERVRGDLQSFRNRSITIGAQEQCYICGVYLLLKPFFLFPCGHKFHGECLEREISQLLDPSDVRRLTQLKQKLSSLPSEQMTAISVNATPEPHVSVRDQIKAELENILAKDCLLCGEHMIETIDKPFIDDWNKMNDDWQ